MKKKGPDLSKARILIADSDFRMAEVLQKVLRELGLNNIAIVKNGKKALAVLESQPVDILITEWDMHPVNGINLIQTLRRTADPDMALIPIIMLTARATADDVMEARDMGVTEFLVKPYTTKSLYQHLERIIDFPRDFIVSEGYIGPDRRRNKQRVEDDRRILQPIVFLKLDKIEMSQGKPMRLVSQLELRRKIGLQQSLREIITPQLLAEAQATIDSFQDESLLWIGEDMDRLEQAAERIISEGDVASLEECKASLLSIRARAGTFHYELQAEAAYDIYKFLRDGFDPANRRHHLVLQKYVEVIKVLLARKVTGPGGEIERKLSQGLNDLLYVLAV